MGTRAYKRLTHRAVEAAKPGSHCDGQGLWLHVSDSGAKKWILRFSFNRHVREMGLGNAHDVWLADARDFGRFNAVYAEFFPKDPPARSTVRADLMIDVKIEIEAIAYRPQGV